MKEKTSAGPGDGKTQDSSVPASSTWWGWAVEPGTDPWWKEAETGDRAPGANSGTHLEVFPGGTVSTLTASLVCASARWYQPVGVSESSLHCSCPVTFSTATDTCRAPSPAEAQAGRDFAGTVGGCGRTPFSLCWPRLPCFPPSPAGLLLQEIFPAHPTHLCLQRAHLDSCLGAYSQSPFSLGLQ